MEQVGQGGFATVQFAAPEALDQAEKVGPAADVYSLASTAVSALLGERLPPGYYRGPERVIPGLGFGTAVTNVLVRGAAVEVEERYQSVAEFCSELAAALKPVVHPEPQRAESLPPGPVAEVQPTPELKIMARRWKGKMNEERYLGNSSKMEVHDLDNEQSQCQIDKIIEAGHDVPFGTLKEAEDAGYDHGAYCIGGSPSTADDLSKVRDHASSDDAQSIAEAFLHGNARALVIRNVEPNKLRVGGREFRVKRNPTGKGCFVSSHTVLRRRAQLGVVGAGRDHGVRT